MCNDSPRRGIMPELPNSCMPRFAHLIAVALLSLVYNGTVVADVQERFVRNIFFKPSVLGQVQSELISITLNDSRPVPFTLIKTCKEPFRIDPFDTQLDGDQIRVNNGVLRLRVRFRTLVAGEYADTIELVRPPDDVIIVRVSGVGVSVSRTREAKFGDLLVGDTSAATTVTVRHPDALSRWRQIAPNVESPDFSLVQTRQVLPGTDSLTISIRFHPVEQGNRVFRAAFERLVEGEPGNPPVPVDTVTLLLSGKGQLQQPMVWLAGDELIVGADTALTGSITMPVRPIKPFVYSFKPSRKADSRVSITLVQPLEGIPSTIARIAFEAAITATFAGPIEAEYVLLRSTPSGSAVDSTIVVVTATVSPAPVLRPTILLRVGPANQDTLWVRIGDTVRLPVNVAGIEPDGIFSVQRAVAVVRYDPSILIPISTEQVSRIARYTNGTMAVAVFSSLVPSAVNAGVTLVEPAFVAVAGNVSACEVLFDSIRIESDDLPDGRALFTHDSSFTQRTRTVALRDVWWSNGGPRYVNTSQGLAELAIEPNPVGEAAVIAISNIPSEGASLFVLDALGREVANFTANVNQGERSIAISPASMGMRPGVYYVRLLLKSTDGGTIYSVVRQMVVI